MSEEKIDLRGLLCPFPVVEVVKIVEENQAKDKLVFLIDDPLAVKSIPEELEIYKEVSLEIKQESSFWEITVSPIENKN